MSTALYEDAAGAIEGMKRLLGVLTDSELADALGLQKTAVAQWRRRNKVPTHVVVRLEQARASVSALPRGAYEEAFPAVVGHYGLMLALLLTPSLAEFHTNSAATISALADAASYFDDLRIVSTMTIADLMRDHRLVEPADAFGLVVSSPDRLQAVRQRALG